MSTVAINRVLLARRGRRLEYFTIAWNLCEGCVALICGVAAGSISLLGFGLDSLIEVTSGAAVLWRMGVDPDAERREQNERRALRIVGACFIVLALYIVYESGTDLLERHAPERSIAGIVLACASLIAMPLLSRAKKTVAALLHSPSLHADAKQTDFCFYLSVILLVGLILNATLGLWWADPLGALAMSPIIFREGVQGIRATKCPGCN